MIRCLRDTDYNVVEQLFEKVFHFSEMTYFIEAWKDRRQSSSIGLWQDDLLIGMAIVCGQKLEFICIDPRHQGQGWGSKVLQNVMENSPSLYLIPIDDPIVCKWYEKHGFHLSHTLEMSDYTMRYYVRHPYSTRSITSRPILSQHNKIDNVKYSK
jgi:ribosomal protein S18 acetylase RimI-like enzyme